MVVIVIVGILAAVAIPKFLDASNKAKASEFPTQLTAVYTGEMAYNAENGSYANDFPTLISAASVDITTTSKWFNYTLTNGGGAGNVFTGTATVSVAFGKCAIGNTGTIDNSNTKACTGGLPSYVGTWK
jgi:type II secretory pathway pseudopilin PulG